MKIKNKFKKLFKNRKLSKNMEKFVEILQKHNDSQLSIPIDKRNLFPPPTDSQLVIDCLADLMLGEDWYVVDPLTVGQVNTLILDEILYKYSKEYAKLCKKKRRK